MQDKVVRVERGVYQLVSAFPVQRTSGVASKSFVPSSPVTPVTEEIQNEDETGFLNAFGMFWRRDEVDWELRGQALLGAQLKASDSINFAEQVGVYILYAGDRVTYVGRVTDQRLGPRLWEHTRDRLTGRWDRFSWFGVRGVTDEGQLGSVPARDFDVTMLVATMEALLIEGLEPPQNRRRGDGFNATEFIQVTDPEVERRRAEQYLHRIMGGKRKP